MNTQIITRQEAQRQGQKFYFSGKACKHGHTSERYTNGGDCRACRIKRATLWNRVNEISRKEITDRYVTDHKDRRKISCSNWQKRNKGLVTHGTRRYQLVKLNRTPPWADLEAIKEFYINCPEGMQVDHVIPLQGKLISGLHVLSNLQYLTAFQNISKGNRGVPS